MNTRPQIVFATNNAKKLGEAQTILQPVFDVLSVKQTQVGHYAPEETGNTFDENAYIKAKTLFDMVKKPVFSDDSGLCVPQLGNEPGVYSSRYAGKEATDQQNYELLLQNLKQQEALAYFHCSICYINEEGEHYFFDGKCEGKIVAQPSGNYGFGYDPVFVPNGFDKTLAELPTEIKNSISHRYFALKHFLAFFTK